MSGTTVHNRLTTAKKTATDQLEIAPGMRPTKAPTSEAWEASILPLNYAHSLITILRRRTKNALPVEVPQAVTPIFSTNTVKRVNS